MKLTKLAALLALGTIVTAVQAHGNFGSDTRSVNGAAMFGDFEICGVQTIVCAIHDYGQVVNGQFSMKWQRDWTCNYPPEAHADTFTMTMTFEGTGIGDGGIGYQYEGVLEHLTSTHPMTGNQTYAEYEAAFVVNGLPYRGTAAVTYPSIPSSIGTQLGPVTFILEGTIVGDLGSFTVGLSGDGAVLHTYAHGGCRGLDEGG